MVAVRISDINAPTLPTSGTPSFSSVAITSSLGSVSGAIPAVPIGPGSLVVMKQVATPTPPIPAAVGKISLSVVFNRTVSAGSGPLKLVSVAPGGFAYQATRVDDHTILSQPGYS